MAHTPALLLANFLADTYQLRLCDIARPAQPENFSNAAAWHIGSGQTAAFVSRAGAVAGASGAPAVSDTDSAVSGSTSNGSSWMLTCRPGTASSRACTWATQFDRMRDERRDATAMPRVTTLGDA